MPDRDATLRPADHAVSAFRLRGLGGAAGMVAAVRVALDADVFGVLAAGPLHEAELIARVALPARGAGVLIRQLRLAGTIDRLSDGRLRATESEEGVRWTLARWDRLSSVLDGKAAEPTDHVYAEITPMLAAEQMPTHVAVADVLGRDGIHLLDLGGGASPVGRLIGARHTDARVSVIDRPAVLATLRDELGTLADRFDLIAADLLVDPLPEFVDVTLLSGVLHLFDDEDVLRILRRAVRATRPGGTVAIVEPLLTEDGLLNPAITTYELDLHLRQPQGGIWPYSQLAEWCARVGLRHLHRLALPRLATLVTGTVGHT